MSARYHYGRRASWRLGRGYFAAGYGLHIARQDPDGGPVLRGDRSWRNAAGLVINTPWGYLFVMVRNLGPKDGAP